MHDDVEEEAITTKGGVGLGEGINDAAEGLQLLEPAASSAVVSSALERVGQKSTHRDTSKRPC